MIVHVPSAMQQAPVGCGHAAATHVTPEPANVPGQNREFTTAQVPSE